MTTGSKSTVDLVVKEEAAGAIVGIPLSSTGEDGKAKSYVVRDEIGTSLLAVNAETQTTTVTGALVIPVYADAAARDAAIATQTNGMLVFNEFEGKLQVSVGGSWSSIAVDP